MRILHIGGYYTVTSELVQQHRELGHDTSSIGTTGKEDPFEFPLFMRDILSDSRLRETRYDIVHVHHPACFMGEDRQKNLLALRHFRELGAKLFYYSFDCHQEESCLSSSGKQSFFQELQGAGFSHLFRGSIGGASPVETRDAPFGLPWSWLAPPLPLSQIPFHPWSESSPHGVRFLHIPFRTAPGDTAAIVETFDRLKAQLRLKFEFYLVPPETLSSPSLADETLRQADVVIESLERESPGLLGYEAMLRGKLVLSGNSPEAQREWSQLALCPAMHTTCETLARRVESIAREPRCLRDLSKRSREYIELYHDPRSMAERTITVYQQTP